MTENDAGSTRIITIKTNRTKLGIVGDGRISSAFPLRWYYKGYLDHSLSKLLKD